MVKRTINNRIEFEEFMIEIDKILTEKDIPVKARSIQALVEAGSLLEIENMKILPIESEPIEGVYEGDSLLAHIVEWIQGRYGDRLNMDFALGYSLVLIRKTPWLIKYPVMIGNIRIICERDLSRKFQNFVVNKAGETRKRPEINLLSLIENLPQQLASELTNIELKELLDNFVYFLDFFIKSHEYYENEQLINIGLADLKDSANYCINGRVTYGSSRWASLQAAEKFLKFYIEKNKENYLYTHDLDKLAKQAYSLGLPPIEAKIIEATNCDPAVRYQTSTASTSDIVNAHLGALKIGPIVIKTLTERKPS